MTATETGCAFRNVNEIGDEIEPVCPVPLDVWAQVLDPTTKQPTGYCKRLRYCTRREVFRDLYKALNIQICPACKQEQPCQSGVWCPPCPRCGAEMESFIDEYFLMAGPDKTADNYVPRVQFVDCHAVTGGSEGHYIHVGFLTTVNGEDNTTHYSQLATGKTFKGMDHAYAIAKRCAELLGA
jgi:hypothetical protein